MSTAERLSSEEVMTQIDAGWQNWQSAIAGLDQAALSEAGACGDWSVKDIAFHLAFWDEQAEFDAAFRHDHNGEAPPARDWQAMNDADHANQKDRPASDALAVQNFTHKSMLHTLTRFADGDLTWAVADLKDHYNEHAEQVRSWRQSKGIPA